MPSYRSHLTVLEQSAALVPSALAFRVPSSDPATEEIRDWLSISYRQFKEDVEFTARHWCSVFESNGIPRGSVIGTWLSGTSYQDVLHIYGISRAGYIPQLFSIRLTSPEVVHELLCKANAKALIYATEFATTISSFALPVYPAVDKNSMHMSDTTLPPLPTSENGNQWVFIFHTSGSTSGSPKLVPCNQRWLDAIVDKAKLVTTPKGQRQDVTIAIGSMCHIGQNFMLIGALQHGTCTIQINKQRFSSEELIDMINRCDLNRLNQFSSFLSTHLRESRRNPKLLQRLRSLDEILYSGLPLEREDEDWAYKNGLKMKNLFGSTECGATLHSIGGTGRDARYLRPLRESWCKFVPIDSTSHSESGHQSSVQFLELVVPVDASDCPDPSLRDSDGHFHTGDLFKEVSPGAYVFLGRNDDWIKSENSLRCDTRAIEDNVRAVCGGMIKDCIVIGTGRPSPALIVEPAEGITDFEGLKKDILRKTHPFHSRRYTHERITRKELIIVARDPLSRTPTKGNIRRRAVEETYRTQLDDIYASLK
ncbi:hypothetical protein ID866_1750 [Astraeus odoratus]|nr:hypothetical protein ID866_1750 [Astraeus odoratus]